MDNWQDKASQWHYAYGTPNITAKLKQHSSHFKVQEQLGFEPDEEPGGQHHWLYVRKTNLNTTHVAKVLAQSVGAQVRDVGFSGMKDKLAVTEQWFTVQLPAKAEPQWDTLNIEGIEILKVKRSGKKLKRGVHKANRFEIVLTDVSSPNEIEARFQRIISGVPNYFGEQRFGHQFRNMDQALAMFDGKRIRDRNLRSMLLSAARSWIFNETISYRWAQQGTIAPVPGDVFMLSGSQSWFHCEQIDNEISERLQQRDIELTGPMWGRGQALPSGQALAFEQSVTSQWSTLTEGLERAGLKQERRAAILVPEQPQIEIQNETATIAFSLGRGAFATSVIRELINT